MAEPSWSGLLWSKYISPRLSCLSWRLLHGKTPTDFWAKLKGWSLASRCYNSLNGEESDLHLFFLCKLAQQFWHWLLRPYGAVPSPPLTASFIWKTISIGRDVSGRKSATTIFFLAISVLWSLRNDYKHSSKQPSLEKAKHLFLDRLRGMAISATGSSPNEQMHPISMLID